MIQHISFPSIEQFRSVVTNVRKYCEYNCEELPVVTFTGTVKLHGSNAAVCYDPKTQQLWFQSREQIITPERDNAGFAWFASQRSEYFTILLSLLSAQRGTDEIVIVFGEWCGGNIQSGVALTGLEKMFVAFDVYYAYNNEIKVRAEDFTDFHNPSLNIYNSYDFPTWETTIDFNNPGASSGLLEELTNQVEQCCPVGKHFSVEGVGEGIVWVGTHPGMSTLRFKVKGEKHSASKVRKGTGVASISPEVQAGIEQFVEYSVTEERLKQGIQRVFTEQGKSPDIKETGTYLKWLFSDIMKEEHDVLAASNLEPKQVSGPISKAGRDWFIKNLELS